VARALAIASLLTLVSTSGLARATEIEDVAVEAGVDPQDLAGAVNSTGLAPRSYLIAVGEVRSEPMPAPPAAYGVWDRLAQCESSGNWHIVGYHHGGLQFLPSTWTAYGGGVYARYAYQASREQQIAIAQKVQAAAGWGQWPVCSRRLGLR